jgi:formylglycine-generating enzyme required for sulfatase activity
MKIKLFLIIMLISVITFITCQSVNRGLKGSLFLTKSDLTVNKMKIAVIAGKTNDDTKAFVKVFTDELKKRTYFEVMSQKEIADKLRSYPEEIVGPYDNYVDTYDENYIKTDKAKLAEIQKKLGVDYIYAFWVPLVFTKKFFPPGAFSEVEIEETWIIGQLFEYPLGEEIGRSNFEIPVKKKGLIIGHLPATKSIGMQERCEGLATELAQRAHIERDSGNETVEQYIKRMSEGKEKSGWKDALNVDLKKIEYKQEGGIDFVKIKGGEFLMGSTDKAGENNEHPRHTVTFDSFYLSKFEITQKQYYDIIGENPSKFKGENLPVENVSYEDALKFCIKFSQKYNIKLRLPSEAEWEYSCRAGSSTEYYWGESFSGVFCWNYSNSNNKTYPVGSKIPNAWGLWDMSGNVAEWCSDWFGEDYYSISAERNPQGSLSGRERIIRGGSYYDDSYGMRCAVRNSGRPSSRNSLTGFRVVLVFQ